MVKKSNWTLLIVIVLGVILSGCARTRMTSLVNREVLGRSFERVLVHGNFQNLEYRRLAEEKICAELSLITMCECFKSLEVFFPGQGYSSEEIASRLRQLRIDVVLVLQPTGSGTSSIYVPQTYSTTGSATIIGNTVDVSSTTHTYGGYEITKPWATFEAILWETSQGKVAWYATAASRGNAFAEWADLISSAANKTVNKLVADGVFPKRKN